MNGHFFLRLLVIVSVSSTWVNAAGVLHVSDTWPKLSMDVLTICEADRYLHEWQDPFAPYPDAVYDGHVVNSDSDHDAVSESSQYSNHIASSSDLSGLAIANAFARASYQLTESEISFTGELTNSSLVDQEYRVEPWMDEFMTDFAAESHVIVQFELMFRVDEHVTVQMMDWDTVRSADGLADGGIQLLSADMSRVLLDMSLISDSIGSMPLQPGDYVLQVYLENMLVDGYPNLMDSYATLGFDLSFHEAPLPMAVVLGIPVMALNILSRRRDCVPSVLPAGKRER